ncbi:hypothetical protein [Micromonospora pisi]|uniref:hypothetical protein n=1 Tax=Micromonospora pisi TaxID=589240 RepID=UPI0011C38B62|nr:hypothetical protein [Micromonospora pisi]
MHHADVLLGESRVRVIELIGDHDPADGTYAMRSFDADGAFTTMRAKVDEDGVWTFANESIRTTLTIGEGGERMAARWERLDDGSDWCHWMDLSFTRLPDGR